MIRVAIHQPEFMGWLGFYYKMSRADVYVVFDNVQYIKRGFLQRNRLRTRDGAQWLTVPVLSKGRYTQTIREVRIHGDVDWTRRHLETLRHCYSKAPFFEEFLPILERAYAAGYELLHELNRAIFEEVAGVLEIHPRFVQASELALESTATQQLIDITKAAGGEIYVTGLGGYRYMDLAAFEQQQVGVETAAYEPRPYPQLHLGFVSHLAAFDALFCVGARGTRALLAPPDPAHAGESLQ